MMMLYAATPSASAEGQVRLYRDRFGVPHAFADSLAGAYFGAGYAMAEDLEWNASLLALQVEGRQAEFFGAEHQYQDIEVRHFRFYEDAKTGFASLSPEIQIALRAYAAGIDRRYEDMSGSGRLRPEWAVAVTAEHLAATFLSSNFYQSARQAADHELDEVGVPLQYPYMGSNAWAVAPSRTADGSTIHFAGPQTPFGDHQPECHLEWPGGRVAGYGFGLFVDPGVGMSHAWGSTNAWPDTSDVYRIAVKSDEEGNYFWRDTLASGAPGGWEPLTPLRFKILVKDGHPFDVRRWQCRLGPVIRVVDDRTGMWAFAYRTSSWRRMAYIEEAFRRMWASSAVEALPPAGQPPETTAANWILADRGGNIAFLYAARVFDRALPGPKLEILNGAESSHEWNDQAWTVGGVKALPMAINPACGFVVSSNEAPWFAAASGEIPGRENWPPWLVPETGWGSDATVRGERARALLSSGTPVTEAQALAYPFDAATPKAKAWVDAWQRAWLAAQPSQRPSLSRGATSVHQILGAWRGGAESDAPAMTAAFLLIREMKPWADEHDAASAAPPPQFSWHDLPPYARALENVAATLQRQSGKLLVPWGEVHGFFRQSRWLPLRGGTDFLPAIFQAHMGSREQEDILAPDSRVRANSGSAHMAVTIFHGLETRRFTISPAGQTNPQVHPNSPHNDDQSELYARGVFKPFWLSEEDVIENLTPYEGRENYPFKARQTLEVPRI